MHRIFRLIGLTQPAEVGDRRLHTGQIRLVNVLSCVVGQHQHLPVKGRNDRHTHGRDVADDTAVANRLSRSGIIYLTHRRTKHGIDGISFGHGQHTAKHIGQVNEQHVIDKLLLRQGVGVVIQLRRDGRRVIHRILSAGHTGIGGQVPIRWQIQAVGRTRDRSAAHLLGRRFIIIQRSRAADQGCHKQGQAQNAHSHTSEYQFYVHKYFSLTFI